MEKGGEEEQFSNTFYKRVKVRGVMHVIMKC